MHTVFLHLVRGPPGRCPWSSTPVSPHSARGTHLQQTSCPHRAATQLGPCPLFKQFHDLGIRIKDSFFYCHRKSGICSCFLIEINWKTMYNLNTSPKKNATFKHRNALHLLYSTALSRTTNRIPKQVYIGDEWSLVTIKWSLQDRWATKDPHQNTNGEWNGAR